MTNRPSRRAFLAAYTAAALPVRAATPTALFDGKTLDGWIQIENSATQLSTAGITDPAAFAAKLATGQDAMSVLLRSRLRDSVKAELAAYSPAAPNAKAVLSELVKDLNQFLSEAGYDAARQKRLQIEAAYPDELAKSVATGWIVKDGVMASTGAGRGVIYTAKDYARFRLMFTMRHVSGNPDHQACILIFCTRPQPGAKPLDALAGIQFQPPNGGHWDYRPGINNAGPQEFTAINKTSVDPHEWSRVEIVADAATGTARMAVAQPPGAKAVEVLAFKDPTAGKPGPVAWQMHNAGLFDEYKDVIIEPDQKDDGLITIR
ncbi:MAG: hypothetical protein JWP63_346 [Candidatus Solibacter sp.]|nr:hypothetical protein [Candidatus Solibacter sp.]